MRVGTSGKRKHLNMDIELISLPSKWSPQARLIHPFSLLCFMAPFPVLQSDNSDRDCRHQLVLLGERTLVKVRSPDDELEIV
jgi:hypothetical protein